MVKELLTQIDSSDFDFNYQFKYFTQPLIPDDPQYTNQNQWYLSDIDVPNAWSLSTGSPAVKVAVFDNGVDWDNPDLGPNNWLGWDFIHNNNNTYPVDWMHWHGNMISSIIASRTNNNIGASGIAGGWNSSPVQIVMCKVGDDVPDYAACTIALDWAVIQGIRIFNFSWGDSEPGCSGTYFPAFRAEIENAYNNFGAIMFASAGNTGQEVSWPACSPQVIAVGGTDHVGNKWTDPHAGSNYGINTDISAPCLDILFPYPYSSSYDFTYETSCSTPIAVGVAALMLSVNPCLSNVDIEYILKVTADKTGYDPITLIPYNYNWDPTRPGHSQELGYGKINAYHAVLMASTFMDEIAEYQNVTFDTPRWFTHNLTLLYGSTLTITSKVTFNEGCRIIVVPGAKLIIDGGTLTSTCPGFWQGIEVQGNPNMPQVPISNQGYCKIFNNGKIERANPGIYSVNGGIVIGIDATFRNNQRAVNICNYSGWNYSNFTRCTFELTDNSGIFGNPYFIGANLVKPIMVNGCTFENKVDVNTMTYPYRGIGIYSLDADVYVGATEANPPGPQPNPINTVFKRLAYGLYSMHSGTQHSVHVSNTIFDENMRGAYISGFNGTSYASVIKSTFKVLNPTYVQGDTPYGLYFNDCSGYTIEENEFYAISHNPSAYGLIINESGPYDNEVYNNSFHNLQFATQAQGSNRYSMLCISGLTYKCNDFYGNLNDIYVITNAPPGTPDQGISLYQGNRTTAAKNTFTEGNSNGYDINNPIDQIEYFMDEYSNNVNVIPDPTLGVNNNIVWNSTYVKIVDCPSHFDGDSGINDANAALAEATAKSDSVETILSDLIDGGSTTTLISTVQMSTPPEAIETRNELLTQSPYLSDSVMTAAINKENVLPNAMIRDILVENPQAAKTDALLEAIDQRFIPMPDSLMAQIMEGQNILGAKEEKQLELTKWNQQYAFAMKSLIRIYDQDSSGIYGVDSIISLLNKDGSLSSQYDLIALYYRKGMYSMGNTILANIPTNYALTDNELLVYNKYVSLFPLIYQVTTNPNGIESLDSIQLALMGTLAVDDKALPGAYARNLMIKTGHLQYEEPILIGSTEKASKKWKLDDPSHSNYKDYSLRVYPNPASNYFIVEYRTETELNPGTTLVVTLTDMKGHELLSFIPKRKFDQVVVPTDNFSSGSFVVSLKINGKQKEQVKLIISK